MLAKINASDIKFRHLLLIIFVFHCLFIVKKVDLRPAELVVTDEEQKIILKLVQENQPVKPKQIVDSEKSNLKTDSTPKFLGKHNNIVDRETVAKKLASFKKAGFGNSKSNNKMNKKSSASKQKKTDQKVSLSDLAIGNDFHKMNMNPSIEGVKHGDKKTTGLGQSNDFVEDIPLGDFTKLNTQEYEFYGFYHRIKEKLEQFWGRNIQDQAEKMYKTGRSIASGRNLLTSLTIVLNSRGEIVKVNINSTSGVTELDEAAVKSFNEAGPFPNPPKGMLKNGYAKIEWGLVVKT